MHRTVAHHCPGLWIVPRLSKNYVYENPQKKESVSNERSFRELLTCFLKVSRKISLKVQQGVGKNYMFPMEAVRISSF